MPGLHAENAQQQRQGVDESRAVGILFHRAGAGRLPRALADLVEQPLARVTVERSKAAAQEREGVGEILLAEFAQPSIDQV